LSASEVSTPRVVSLADAASYAGVPTGTLRHYIRTGQLPVYRFGPRLIQVNLDDVDAFRQPIAAAQSAAKTSHKGRRNER
jgi:excisionase family DNA binding protein